MAAALIGVLAWAGGWLGWCAGIAWARSLCEERSVVAYAPTQDRAVQILREYEVFMRPPPPMPTYRTDPNSPC